jgi:hypothetical protein
MEAYDRGAVGCDSGAGCVKCHSRTVEPCWNLTATSRPQSMHETRLMCSLRHSVRIAEPLPEHHSRLSTLPPGKFNAKSRIDGREGNHRNEWRGNWF